MRVRSTDAVSRSDDTGSEFLDPGSEVLDWDAPGRFESFPSEATYSREGFDSSGAEALWREQVSQWPVQVVGILCEESLYICEADRTDSRGLSLRYEVQLPSLYLESLTDPRRHKVQLYPGGIFVLREGDTLWDVSLSEATYTAYRSPGLDVAPDLGLVLDGGEVCPNYDGMSLTILSRGVFAQGDVMFVGGAEAVELFYRKQNETSWSRPWQSRELKLSDITLDAEHRFYDLQVREDGIVFALGYKAGQLVVARTQGVFSPENLTIDNAPGLDQWVLEGISLPIAFAESVQSSEVSSDPTTQIEPKLVFSSTGALYVQTSVAILHFPHPSSDLGLWSVWVMTSSGVEGIDAEVSPLPGDGHIAGLAFDGLNPGILQRLNPDSALSDDALLYVYNQSFRDILWTRRYESAPRGLRVNRLQYPRSSMIHLGKTPSPPEGQGPDEEILGGEV